MLLGRLLNRLIGVGRLVIVDAGGRTHVFAGGEGPSITVRLHDKALHWRLFWQPELCTGEAYMDGTLTIEDGTLYDFLDLIGRNIEAAGNRPLSPSIHWIERMFRRLYQFNPKERARRNVAHHYDLSGALYDLFLDDDRQYSCAYFRRPGDGLETAQEQKKRHIAAKLLLEPGMTVLDIGSGWGGLDLYLAENADVKVTGVTLSTEQLNVSRRRADETGLAGRVEYFLRDYREQTGVFDRIVSVGMFEHVGVGHFDAFFSTVRDRLADDGVALLHMIGRADGPGVTDPWIRKYIFPGGYFPALSEVSFAIEKAGLWVTDIEVLRLHYAETLRHWRRRFLANRDKAVALYDERFCRMWEFYLAASEISFRYMNCAVYQIQLAKRQEAVPLTRDYMAKAERRLAAAESRESDRAA
jgi:cyclopropane-fatty-acyl-phospholipid synthase